MYSLAWCGQSFITPQLSKLRIFLTCFPCYCFFTPCCTSCTTTTFLLPSFPLQHRDLHLYNLLCPYSPIFLLYGLFFFPQIFQDAHRQKRQNDNQALNTLTRANYCNRLIYRSKCSSDLSPHSLIPIAHSYYYSYTKPAISTKKELDLLHFPTKHVASFGAISPDFVKIEFPIPTDTTREHKPQ